MKNIIPIISFLIMVPITGHPQERLSLTYDEAIEIALDNNIILKQQKNVLTGIQANKAASLGSLGPNISAFGQGWRINGNFFVEQDGQVYNTRSDNLYGQLDANLRIFNGLSLYHTIKREKHNFDAQLFFIDRTRQTVIGDVTAQYLTVLQDQEQLKIARQNLLNQQVLLDQISAMFEAGSRAITDKYDQEYQVKNAELGVIRAENTLRNDKAILAQTLLIDPTGDFSLQEPDWDINDINFTDYNPEDIYDIALQSRTDLKSARENEAATKMNIQAMLGSYFPTLSGFYGWSSRWTDLDPTRDVSQQFLTDNIREQYGFRLNIPIYSGLRNRATVVNAKVNHENAKLDVENQEISILSEVLRAYQNFKDVNQFYQVSLVQFQSAEKALETQRESYEVGITNLIELSNANRDFIDAQGTLSRAKYALLFQRILMDFALGTLTVDQITE